MKTGVGVASQQCRCESPGVWMAPLDPPRRPITIPKPVTPGVFVDETAEPSESTPAVETVAVAEVIEESTTIVVETPEPDELPSEEPEEIVDAVTSTATTEPDAEPAGEDSKPASAEENPKDDKRKSRRRRNRGRRRK